MTISRKEVSDELYVWFASEEGQAKDQWRVIVTASYPARAVY